MTKTWQGGGTSSSFTGTFTTSIGIMIVTVSSTTVTGVIQGGPTFTGTVTGTTWTGTVTTVTGTTGTFIFTSTTTGFTGSYTVSSTTVTLVATTISITVTLTPATATNPVGTTHTVTATVTDQNGNLQANVQVGFKILSGPNAGLLGYCSPSTCKTDSTGKVSWTYTSAGQTGTDSIQACLAGQSGSSGLPCCSSQVAAANSGGEPVQAAKSASIVIIGAATVDTNCNSGANVVINGGCLAVDTTGALAGLKFSGMATSAVSLSNLNAGAYDTAVLNVASSGMNCNTGTLTSSQKSDLVNFVGQGKKLIIYDSECQGSGASQSLDYSWLPYPFTTANPGAQGAQGTLNIVENDSLTTGVDAKQISSDGEIGDMNVMTTKDAHWCLAMSGTNALNVTGPVEAYAKYPAGTDSGLFIYDGMDQDATAYDSTATMAQMRTVWANQLQQAFNPSNLPCGVAVVGISLSPATATTPVGQQYTVTATVKDQTGKAQVGVVVSFSVTAGPNTGSRGTGTTNSSGQATYSYTSSTTGTDTIQACFTPAGSSTPVCAATVTNVWTQGGTTSGTCSNTVTKTWQSGGTSTTFTGTYTTTIGIMVVTVSSTTVTGVIQGGPTFTGTVTGTTWTGTVTTVTGITGSFTFTSTTTGFTGSYTVSTTTITVIAISTTVSSCGGTCTLSAPGQIIGSSSTTTTITVTATSTWTTVIIDTWITIVSGASGNGNGTVTVSVATNTGPPRYGVIVIAGQIYVIYQSGTASGTTAGCGYLIQSNTTQNIPVGGTISGFIQVITAQNCAWTAGTLGPWSNFITITSPLSGAGNAGIAYTVPSNANGPSRSGAIMIAGQVVAINQAGGVVPGGPTISAGGVVNTASYAAGGPPNGALAQGSFFSIYGSGVGPDPPVQATGYPLPTSLGGVTVQITQGSNTYSAYLVFVYKNQINAILPSNVPTGSAQVVLTYNGLTTPPATITVAPTRLGLFFQQVNGVSMAIAQNVNSATDYPLNLPGNPAKPGQYVILWGTGMGPINGADNVAPSTVNAVGNMNNVPVTITVGGVNAPSQYAGRQAQTAAVDNVYFIVPNGVPYGCQIPVLVTAGGVVANNTNISITQDGSPCQ